MSDRDHATQSYRQEFAQEELARTYDASEYGAGSWSSLLWRLEQRTLNALLESASFVPHRDRYLDFACGTGRVLSYLAPHFDTAAGVDISEAMLVQARRRAPRAVLRAADVTTDPEVVGGEYDLVTSFRFLLNADPSDRLPAMRWIRSRLRDENSRVVVNNHGNLWTHKAVTHALRRLRGGHRGTTGNVLSHRQVLRLAEASGFEVESVHGMGLLGGQALRLIPFERMTLLQEALREKPFVELLGEDQLYVLAAR